MPSGEPPRLIENRHVEPPIVLRRPRCASPEGATSHHQRIPYLVFADRALTKDARERTGSAETWLPERSDRRGILADDTQVLVYLTHKEDYAKMNEVYRRHFSKPYPNRGP